MSTLRFLPSNICVQAFPGQTVFAIGWKRDVGIQSACVGKGTCGLCRVTIIAGAELLSPYNDIEDKHLGNLYHLTRRRLSCQCIIQEGEGEIVVEVHPKRPRKG